MTNNQLREITGDLDLGFKCWIHKETLECVVVPNEDRFPEMEEDMWKEELRKIRMDRKKYVEIKPMDPRSSFRVMEEFIASVDDEPLRERLEQAIRRPRPFFNFNGEVDRGGPYRDKWFAFRERKLMDWVEEQVLRIKP